MLYVDVDSLSKLAHWNILALLPALTGQPWTSMSTVSSLRHRARRAIENPDGKLFITSMAAKNALKALEQMAVLDEPNPKVLAAFSESKDIDPGEAILMAQTLKSGGGILVTGDKRAIRGLAKMAVAIQFSERILILEQIVMKCLNSKGRQWLLDNVCPHRAIDKAIAACLGSTCQAPDLDIIQGLTSYIHEMEVLHSPSLLLRI